MSIVVENDQETVRGLFKKARAGNYQGADYFSLPYFFRQD